MKRLTLDARDLRKIAASKRASNQRSRLSAPILEHVLHRQMVKAERSRRQQPGHDSQD